MSEKKHFDQAPSGASPGGGPNGNSSKLNAIRAQGKDLLSAGDDAIQATVTRDSEKFNQQNKQRGGQ